MSAMYVFHCHAKSAHYKISRISKYSVQTYVSSSALQQLPYWKMKICFFESSNCEEKEIEIISLFHQNVFFTCGGMNIRLPKVGEFELQPSLFFYSMLKNLADLQVLRVCDCLIVVGEEQVLLRPIRTLISERKSKYCFLNFLSALY